MKLLISLSAKMTDERKSAIEKLADEGKNSAQIAKTMGDITPNTVAAYLKSIGKFESGAVKGNSHKLTDAVKGKIDKLAEEGKNSSQIAKELGDISYHTVAAYLKSIGKYVKGHKYQTDEKEVEPQKLDTRKLKRDLVKAIENLAAKYKCSTEEVLAVLNR